MIPKLDSNYWNQRYLDDDTPWDVGNVSRPMKVIIDELKEKSLRILVPGAGSGHEVAYLQSKGFKNVFVCEWSERAASILRETLADFPSSNILVEDFFELSGTYDLILEQTFFCALPRNIRLKYVEKASELLETGGAIRGVLFASEFPFEGPPFGGTIAEYQQLFQAKFRLDKLDVCQNSIPQRIGNELEIYFTRL